MPSWEGNETHVKALNYLNKGKTKDTQPET